MEYVYSVELALLALLGFVPNKRNTAYHTASVTIGGHTVWCKNLDVARKIANRVMRAFYAKGLNVRYRIESEFGDYKYNW